ncbi:MAG: adenosine deaminase [Candidatus Marinimicrobia bacterium]|nr:adenosine deaminase [Candidatus Neomarinimicrobiota bacterium]MBL7010310.1 adenosine deaminase [Candidatus Neomarinimicrobiota bacterium]MBL7030565.1 adenosine deaminase [Candidatus Neomarinimicrobiota bacterium]
MTYSIKIKNILCVLLLGTATAQYPIAQSRDEMFQFISEMPKAELHVHLEGTMSPQTIVKLANRNGYSFFNNVEDVFESLENRAPGLGGFLQHHDKQVSVIQTENDFYTLTYDFLKNCFENNIVYVEFFFDPQIHSERGIAFESVLEGILKGKKAGEKNFNIKSNLIMCANREKSIESAMEILEKAKPYKNYIVGIGLDNGPENGNPPVKFTSFYQEAKRQGYYLTIHNDVDEANSVEHIWQAIDILKVDRLDHSINAIEDLSLVEEINNREIYIAASPVQRRRDPVPQDIGRIKFMLDHGMNVSLHSDDPGEFESGYLTKLLFNFQQAGHFSKRDMARFMLNAFKATWLEQADKDAYIKSFKKWAKENGVRI